jgi:hypothetical protein
MRAHVVQGDDDRIIGIAPCVQCVNTSLPGVPATGSTAERAEAQEVRVRIDPLPGQTVHEVELPSALEQALERRDVGELSELLLRYRLTSGKAALVDRDV